MRTLIIDDEAQAISALKSEIQYHCPQLEIVGEAHSVKEGIEMIRATKPQLIFLDIQLSDGLGFDIIAAYKEYEFKIIFTTAYSKYAIQAIKISALDYLLKPIDPEELKSSVQKATGKMMLSTMQEQLSVLMQQMAARPESEEKQIVLKDVDKTYFIRINDILYCEADGSYTKFYLVNADPVFVSRNLRSYEELLAPAGFIRTHHSCLVNPNKIKVYDRKTDSGTLVLEGGYTIPVSQRKKEFVMQFLENRR